MGDVALRNTFRIGATLQLGAYVLAFGHAVSLGACSMRGTIFVRFTLDGAATTLVIRITDKTGRAATFVRTARIATPSTGSARSILTEIDHIATHARIATEAGLTMTDLSMILGSAECILSTRLSDQACDLAHMIIAALVVGAILIAVAFDLAATGASISEETLLAYAVGCMRTCHTLGISATGSTSQADRFAASTSVGIQQASLILATVAVQATLEFLGANIVLAELELRTGRVRFAGALADTLQAQLLRNTVAIAAAEWTADAMGTDAALRTLCILLTVLQGYTTLFRVSRTARLAGTKSQMILHGATGVGSTGIWQRAGINALGIQTRLLGGTVSIVHTLDVHTFMLGISSCVGRTTADCLVRLSLTVGIQSAGTLPLARTTATRVLATGCRRTIGIAQTLAGIATAGLQWISDQSLGTLAAIAARQIVAEGSAVTGLCETLVDVLADSVDQLITLEALATCPMIPHLAIALTAAG